MRSHGFTCSRFISSHSSLPTSLQSDMPRQSLSGFSGWPRCCQSDGLRSAARALLSIGQARRSVTMKGGRRSGAPTNDSCYLTGVIHDLITAFLVACTAILASEVLTRIWESF
jgi:hypothetical protein